jgi:hypothetical protein
MEHMPGPGEGQSKKGYGYSTFRSQRHFLQGNPETGQDVTDNQDFPYRAMCLGSDPVISVIHLD